MLRLWELSNVECRLYNSLYLSKPVYSYKKGFQKIEKILYGRVKLLKEHEQK